MQKKSAKDERIKREKHRRTDDILQAARNVMLIKSYTGATMDDIAAKAGLTKPTIYQYFKTKDELFVGLIEPVILTMAEKLEAISTNAEAGKYKSGKQIIHDVYNVYYDMFETDPELFRLFNIFLQVGFNADMSSDALIRVKEMGRRCFVAGNSIVSASITR